MNDEIKEILEEIDNKIIPNEHWNKIKDYITNLQQENEELRRFRYTIRKDETKTPPTITRTYKREYENLKQRIYNAIEYIEDNTYKSYEIDYMDLTGIKELLNILNGGDEE